MKLFHSILLLLVTASLINAQLYIGRVSYSSLEDKNIIEANCISIYHDEIPGLVDIILTAEHLESLQQFGFQVQDVTLFQNNQLDELDPEYHTYEEYHETLQQYADDFPGLCKLDSIGHSQQFNRTIWCIKLSDSPELEEDEITLLYISVHHGLEVIGGETLLYMIGHLLEEYGTNPDITFWLDNYEIFFVPLLNPDGHHAVAAGINDYWRKTARDLDQDSVFYEMDGNSWTDDHEGIDLNFNYDWNWAGGGSPYDWAFNSRGDAPFSESETQSLQSLVEEQRPGLAASLHSYGEIIVYPWTIYPIYSPDIDIIEHLVLELANGLIKDSGAPYDTMCGGGDAGQCRNWLYGKWNCIGFCIELLPLYTFYPPGEELEWRNHRYYNGLKYLLQAASRSGISGHIYDAITGDPVHARVEITDRISLLVEPRYNEPVYGRYTRYLLPGEYGISVSAEGYDSTVVVTSVFNDTLTVLDIDLMPQTSVDEKVVANRFELGLKCFPNPFNSFLNISCNYSASSKANLKIFDIDGRIVETINPGWSTAGDHSFQWNAHNCSSGIYFVQLHSSAGAITKKVVLIK